MGTPVLSDSSALDGSDFESPLHDLRKQHSTQQSLLNGELPKDYGALAIAEPHMRVINGKVVTSPVGHLTGGR